MNKIKRILKQIIDFFKGIRVSTIYKLVGIALLFAILFWVYTTWKSNQEFSKKTQADTYINGKVTNKGEDYIIVEDEDKNEYYIPNTNTEDIPIGSDVNAVVEEKIEEPNTNQKEENEKTTEETEEQPQPPKTITSSNVTVTNEKTENKNADAEVISYFQETDKEIENTSLKEEIKTRFISVVDFLFYDGTIKGYKLDDLSSKAKLQILKIALSIDSKIEKYFPGYKETITSTTGKIYTGLKTKIVESYLKVTTKICNYDPDTCNQAKQDFQDMKKAFSITWELIKDLASSGIANLKDWYEIFSGKTN